MRAFVASQHTAHACELIDPRDARRAGPLESFAAHALPSDASIDRVALVRLARLFAREHVRMYSVCALGVLTSVRVARVHDAERATTTHESDNNGSDPTHDRI